MAIEPFIFLGVSLVMFVGMMYMRKISLKKTPPRRSTYKPVR